MVARVYADLLCLFRSIPGNADADMDVKFTVKTNLEIKVSSFSTFALLDDIR